MAISNATSTFGSSCKTQATSTLISGSSTLGNRQTVVSFPTANIGYSVRSVMSLTGNNSVFDIQAGTATGTANDAGVAQVITSTITAASGITSSNTCTVTVTSSSLSPNSTSVVITLTSGQSATQAAAAIAAGLAFNAAISAIFSATSSGAIVTLTRKRNSDGNYPANDATLNIVIPTGLGITAVAVANPTAGVATTGTFIYDADGKDFEGVTLPTLLTLYSLEINVIRGSASASNGAHTFPLPAKFWFSSGNTGVLMSNDLTIAALSNGTEVTITVLGKST